MIEEFLFSEFPLNGAEVEDYCNLFATKYGEDSKVFNAVDAAYARATSANGTWVSFLNDLRKKLCEEGFEKEVTEQDSVFLEKMTSVLSATSKHTGKTVLETRRSYTPMSERWGTDIMK